MQTPAAPTEAPEPPEPHEPPEGVAASGRRSGVVISTIIVLLVLVLGTLLIQSQVGEGLALTPGSTEAPDFRLPGIEGEDIHLAALRGKPVFLNFWASWCTSCKIEAPVLEQAAVDHGDRIQFLGVAINDSLRWAREYADEYGMTYPSAIDPTGATMRAYGITGTPETFIIDADGVILERWIGPVSPETLERLIAPLLTEGTAAPVADTP